MAKPCPLIPTGVPKHHMSHISKMPDGICHSECPEDCARTAVSVSVDGDWAPVEYTADEATLGCP